MNQSIEVRAGQAFHAIFSVGDGSNYGTSDSSNNIVYGTSDSTNGNNIIYTPNTTTGELWWNPVNPWPGTTVEPWPSVKPFPEPVDDVRLRLIELEERLRRIEEQQAAPVKPEPARIPEEAPVAEEAGIDSERFKQLDKP